MDAPPSGLNGEVTKVDKFNKQLELSIGSDDGLVPGHELYLYRTKPRAEYLGKIKVLSVDPDQAVAKVIGTTIQGKKIQEGDIVSSTIRPRPLAAARGAPAAGRPGVFVQAPKSDIYVALLGVALFAMIVGIILLGVVWKRYDFKTKPTAVTPVSAVPTALAANLEKIVSVRL